MGGPAARLAGILQAHRAHLFRIARGWRLPFLQVSLCPPWPPLENVFAPWTLKISPQNLDSTADLAPLAPRTRPAALVLAAFPGEVPRLPLAQALETLPSPWLGASWPWTASLTGQQVTRPCSQPGFSLAALRAFWLLCLSLSAVTIFLGACLLSRQVLCSPPKPSLYFACYFVVAHTVPNPPARLPVLPWAASHLW